MKITIEFEDWRELRAILVGLASTIELPEPCEDARTPMTQEGMMQALRPTAQINNRPNKAAP
jgi:hypothetical protein